MTRVTARDVRRDIQDAAGDQDAISAPAIFAFAAVPARTAARYGDRAMRYVQIEIGHAGQNLFLEAVALGLGDLEDLTGQTIALDAFNTIYYFLAVIRHKISGEPLKDHADRITSHLSGLLYRTVSFLEVGIKPVYVFNGHYPHFKKQTVRKRRAKREAATRKWKEAVRRGEPALKYAQEAARIDADIVDTSKELLDLMGVPWH